MYTDHKNLSWLYNSDKGKLMRWALKLQEFDIDIRYIEGSNNCIADWLSRCPPDDQLQEYMLCPLVLHSQIRNPFDLPTLPTVDDIASATEAEQGDHKRNIIWKNNVPYWHRTGKLYVPEKYRQLVLWWFHASHLGGHIGIKRLIRRLNQYFSWPHLPKDATTFVDACILCKMLRFAPLRKGVLSLDSPILFGIVALDYIGPLSYGGCKSNYIGVAIDHFSRYMVCITTATPPTSDFTQKFLQRYWVNYFGCPRALLTDRGSTFISADFTKYVAEDLRIPLINTSPYYPQGNAINEASHKFLHHVLKTSYLMTFNEPFGAVVSCATMIYNSTPHSQLGTTPYNLVFGQDMVIPGWTEFTPISTEPTRQITRMERLYRALGKEMLSLLNTTPTSKTEPFRLGDVITYSLSQPESAAIPHRSGTVKWNAQWSPPQRVMKVKLGQLSVQPLWTRGRLRDVPKTQCRLLNPSSPRSLRDLVPYVLQIPISSEARPRRPRDDMLVPVPISQPPPAQPLPTPSEEMIKRIRTR